ncbi:bifunctional adenosylcobinamide kinase/adenosylcobinamide-phosphate guanylyltransferase [Undibacterium arcticum]
MRTLILGGSRSGKSAYAEQLAAASGKEVIYIATAQAGDAEMAQRIALHRQQRPAHWHTVEQPLALGDAIAEWSAPARVLLVDCLTLWLSNLLFAEAQDFPEIGRITPPACFSETARTLLTVAAAGQWRSAAGIETKSGWAWCHSARCRAGMPMKRGG